MLQGLPQRSGGVKLLGLLLALSASMSVAEDGTNNRDGAKDNQDGARDTVQSKPEPRRRILFRRALPQGLSVEINTLGPYRYIEVHFRERGGDFANRDSSLGTWAIQIPELIGTSDGFIFGFDPDRRWEPVPGQPNVIQYENESHPIGPDVAVAFAGQEKMINRNGRLKYRARVTVKGHRLEIEMAITNLANKPTSVFTDICNRFHGRGNIWGWQNRTRVKVADEWILAKHLFQGDGFPASVRWFVRPRLPSADYMHEFRPGSANDPRTQIITSPYICMPLEDGIHTMLYGSPQGSMVFFNPDNPCVHSDAWSPDVAPGDTVVQKTVLSVYRAQMAPAIDQFERERKAEQTPQPDR